MFRTQSREVYESGGYHTAGVEMMVTAERVILLDSQPILSDTMHDQLSHNPNTVPRDMTPTTYLQLMVSQYILTRVRTTLATTEFILSVLIYICFIDGCLFVCCFQSLQMAMFLYSVCHVVMVVIDSLDSPDVLFQFLWMAEQMKTNCLGPSMDATELP